MLGAEIVEAEVVIDLGDDDVEEIHDDELITQAEAQDAIRDRDHRIAVNTAQELIRQRGILMEDLEAALNMCRRYRGILADNALPDPHKRKLAALLTKYNMDGPRKWGDQTKPKDAKSIPAKTSGLPACTCPEDAYLHERNCPRHQAILETGHTRELTTGE